MVFIVVYDPLHIGCRASYLLSKEVKEKITMRQCHLGKEGLVVSVLGLGCLGMTGTYGKADEKESISTIHRALDLGINYLDTADAYGPFKNEELVGKAIRDRRDRLILATKFGSIRSSDPSFRGVNGRPEYVKAACDASLSRLGVDYIDLYYQHRVDPNVPIEETVGAMADLVQAGKVRYLGLCEAGPDTIRRGHRTHPITALQSEYSLWSRDPEAEILPLLHELGIGFVAYSPLGRGFLTGRIKRYEDLAPGDWRRSSPRFQGEDFAKNLELVQQVEAIASQKGVTAAQLALAWVLAKSQDIVAIPGTTRRAHLEENIGSLDIKLTEADLSDIESAMPPGAVRGTRYSEAMMRMINL